MESNPTAAQTDVQRAWDAKNKIEEEIQNAKDARERMKKDFEEQMKRTALNPDANVNDGAQKYREWKGKDNGEAERIEGLEMLGTMRDQRIEVLMGEFPKETLNVVKSKLEELEKAKAKKAGLVRELDKKIAYLGKMKVDLEHILTSAGVGAGSTPPLIVPQGSAKGPKQQ